MQNQTRRAVLFINEEQSALLSAPVLGTPLIEHIATALAEAGITAVVAIGAPYYPAVASAFGSFLQLERREEAVPHLMEEAEITYVFTAPTLVDAAALSDLRTHALSLGSAVLLSGAKPLVYAICGAPEEAQARAVVAGATDGFCISGDMAGLCCAASTLGELIMAEEALQLKIVARHIKNGVRVSGGASVRVAPSVVIAVGATILQNTVLEGETEIGAGCVVGPNTVLRSAKIAEGAVVNSSQVINSQIGRGTTVGPFAYIRDGAKIGEHCRVGDFVEIKNSVIGDDTKMSHLTYVGDSDVGARVNFGCGTVTVNYNGAQKQRTTIGDDAFIGCNTNLIAPVKVGARAYTAAGTTVTNDVPDEALSIGRVRAEIKQGWWSRLVALREKYHK